MDQKDQKNTKEGSETNSKAPKRNVVNWPLVLANIFTAAFTVFANRYIFNGLDLFFVPRFAAKILGFIMVLIYVIIMITSLRAVKKAMEKHILCTTGIFSIIRHPIYSAALFFVIPGVALLYNQMAILMDLLIVFLMLKFYFVPKEETELIREFGKEYENYAKKSYALIPLIY